MATNFVVNGRPASTDAPAATPLLWVIREQLKLTGTKFGCGAGLCGACTIHIDGKRRVFLSGPGVRDRRQVGNDYRRPVAQLQSSAPEGLDRGAGAAMRLLPVRPDHGAAALLEDNPKPTRAQIVEHMSTNICRCGTYQRIVGAVERAAREG